MNGNFNEYSENRGEFNFNSYPLNIDNELLKAFIGNNYEKIVNRNVNFSAFFFPGDYLFYRKMDFYGLILLFITVLEIIFVPTSFLELSTYLIIYSAIFLGIRLILMFSVNFLYVRFAKKKIAKIRKKFPNANFQELKEKCKKMGGTTVIGLITGTLIAYILLEFAKVFRENHYEYSISATLYPEHYLNYEFPTDYWNELSYMGVSEFNYRSCEADIKLVKGYKNSLDLYDEEKNSSLKYEDYNTLIYEPQTIGKLTWHSFSYINPYTKTLSYGFYTDYKRKVYKYIFKISETADRGKCENDMYQILNSISPKK